MRYSRHAVRGWRWQNEGKGDKAMKFKLTSLEKKWVLYDVGNSAFTMMVSTIFPIYFNYLAGKAGIWRTGDMQLLCARFLWRF